MGLILTADTVMHNPQSDNGISVADRQIHMHHNTEIHAHNERKDTKRPENNLIRSLSDFLSYS